MKFLDSNGLSRLWAKVKALVGSLPDDADFTERLADSEVFVGALTSEDGRFVDALMGRDLLGRLVTSAVIGNPVIGPEWASAIAILISKDEEAGGKLGRAKDFMGGLFTGLRGTPEDKWAITNAIDFIRLPLVPGAFIDFGGTPGHFFGIQRHPEKGFACAIIGDTTGTMLVRVYDKPVSELTLNIDMFG